MNQTNLQEAMSVARIRSRVPSAMDLGQDTLQVSDARRMLPAWCFVIFSAVFVCVMVFAGALGSSDCRVKPIPLVLGTDSEISIGLPADTPCTILVQVGSKVVEDITIGTLPEHGTLMLRGRTGVIYRPESRFRGDDSFAFSISSRSGPTGGSSTVRVRARIG
jgi:hypothetical protein